MSEDVTFRKEPKQERSRRLVDAILEAAARILRTSGPAKSAQALAGAPVLTTNRVAEVAGVSVGSLYQYFPGKKAITAAIIRQSVKNTYEPLVKVLETNEALPLEELVAKFVDQAVDFMIRNLAVLPGIVAETVHQSLAEEAFKLDGDYVARFAAALERLKPKVRADLPAETAAYLLFHSLRASALLASLQRPELLQSPGFRLELRRMLMGYLSPIQSFHGAPHSGTVAWP